MSDFAFNIVTMTGRGIGQLFGDVMVLGNLPYAKMVKFEPENKRLIIKRIDSGNLETLVYSDVSNIWWCYEYNNMDKRHVFPTSEFKDYPQYAVVCENKKFINFSIAKNCASSILLNAMNSDQDLNLGEGDVPWYIIQKEKTLVNMKFYDEITLDDFSDYLKFIVYRDPVDRFINVMNYSFTGNRNIIGSPYLNHKLDKLGYIEEFMKLAEIQNINEDLNKGDEHILSQYRLLKDIEDKSIIDYVVYPKDLNDFAKNVLGYDNFVWTNKSSKREITKDDLTSSQIEKVKQIYQKDYELFEEIKDKMYKV